MTAEYDGDWKFTKFQRAAYETCQYMEGGVKRLKLMAEKTYRSGEASSPARHGHIGLDHPP